MRILQINEEPEVCEILDRNNWSSASIVLFELSKNLARAHVNVVIVEPGSNEREYYLFNSIKVKSFKIKRAFISAGENIHDPLQFIKISLSKFDFARKINNWLKREGKILV